MPAHIHSKRAALLVASVEAHGANPSRAFPGRYPALQKGAPAGRQSTAELQKELADKGLQRLALRYEPLACEVRIRGAGDFFFKDQGDFRDHEGGAPQQLVDAHGQRAPLGDSAALACGRSLHDGLGLCRLRSRRTTSHGGLPLPVTQGNPGTMNRKMALNVAALALAALAVATPCLASPPSGCKFGEAERWGKGAAAAPGPGCAARPLWGVTCTPVAQPDSPLRPLHLHHRLCMQAPTPATSTSGRAPSATTTDCKTCVETKPQFEWACDECSAKLKSDSAALGNCYTCVKDQTGYGPTAWA